MERSFVTKPLKRRKAEKPLKELKVAICTPVYGMTNAKFTHSLSSLLVYSLSHANFFVDDEPAQLNINFFMVQCSMLTEGRHKLVAEALLWGADYMLCLDADHVFPHDTLMRLLAHGLPIVGCNYPRRITPTAPTAAAESGTDDEVRHVLYTTEEKANEGLVEQCEHLGFGVLLINMKVFDALQAHHEKEYGDGNFLPLFLFEPTENKVGMIGEDVYFFRKMAKAGIKPFVDHGLSWLVGHCHEIVLTNAHACMQKERWIEKKAAEKHKMEHQIEHLEREAEERLLDAK